VRFTELAELAEELTSEGSRLKKRAAIAEAIARVAAQDGAGEAGRFCLYLAGQPFAEADPRKLNAGGAILSRVLKVVTGASDAALAAAYRRHGDMGAAAAELWRDRDEGAAQALTLGDVAEAFEAMAGARSTAVRASAVEGLLRRATAVEAKYLLKLMLGDMRIGVKQSLVEEAIAEAASSPKSQNRDPSTDSGQVVGQPVSVAAVRQAVMLEADLSRAVERTFAGTLDEARMRLFHSLGFMLASPVETPEEAVERFMAKPKKVVVKAKRGRRKKGASDEEDVEAVLAVDAAEEGFAEDVEAEAAEENAGVLRPLRDARGPQDDSRTSGRLALKNGVEAKDVAAIHAVLEDKYDGIRAQVHCGDAEQPGRVAIYSRNREDITESFPEIEEAFARVAEVSELGGLNGLIFDGEILGWDLGAEKALPFSVLGQRIGRKRVDDAMRRAIPVVFMAFDLLFAEGELMLARPLRERRAKLEDVVGRMEDVAIAPIERAKAQAGLFDGVEMDPTHRDKTAMNGPPEVVRRLRLSPAKMVESAEGIDRAYREARARANEGVMIKAAGSAYLPGRRGLAWLKLKRELATLDVVITGAEFGHGRRARLLSDYTFAVRARQEDGTSELVNVGKAYSGVTDAEIAELTEWLKAHTIEDRGHFRTVEPLRVLEVAFNNVMRSERHSSGFALRFPRILRVRDDKPVEEIDTLGRVEEIYQSQPDKMAE
jgi:DNA ligase-1